MSRILSRAMLAALSVLLLSGAAFGVQAAPSRLTSYILPGNAVFPEDVAFQRSTGNFFVSSTGDGSVLRGNVRQHMAHPFIAGSGVQFSAVGLKLDRHGHLIVVGGPTGEIRVYRASTGALLSTFNTGAGGFLNDLVVTRTGDVFVTDSSRPILWHLTAAQVASGSPAAVEMFVNFTGTPFVFEAGFNANGIVVSPDGRSLLISQTNTGKLFRVDIASKAVTQVDLHGQLVAGDGLALRGLTLFAVANGQIVKVQLREDFSSGRVLSRTSDASFAFPTTVAIARGRLLVVNSQFDKLGGTPVLPFTVSSIRIP